MSKNDTPIIIVPKVIKIQAINIFKFIPSFKIKAERNNTKTRLNLSMVTTFVVSPSWRALKYQSQDNPVINPETIKNIQVLLDRFGICWKDFVENTIPIAYNNQIIYLQY